MQEFLVQRFALSMDIWYPHSDHSHSMNIVNKDGIEAYEKIIAWNRSTILWQGIWIKKDVSKNWWGENSRPREIQKMISYFKSNLVALNEYKEQVQQKREFNRRLWWTRKLWKESREDKRARCWKFSFPWEQKMNATHEETIRKISELSLKDYEGYCGWAKRFSYKKQEKVERSAG